MKPVVSAALVSSVVVLVVLRVWKFAWHGYAAWATPLDEACLGVLMMAAALWPFVTRRRFRVLLTSITLPMPLQVVLQLLMAAGASWSWWRAVADFAVR